MNWRFGLTRRTLIWLFAGLGLLFNVLCFYPGQMGYDDAVTWARARGAPSDDVGGVGLLLLWRLTEHLVSGPAGPYLVELLIFWVGMASFTVSLKLDLPASLAQLMLAGLAPICFLALGRMGTDTALMAALLGAFAAMFRYREKRDFKLLLVAAFLLWWCLTLRRNALPAVVPLVAYGAWLEAGEGGRARLKSIVAKSSCAVLALGLLAAIAFDGVDQRRTVFPATALWDLAAMSVDVDRLLLPAGTHGPALDIADLKQAVVPYSNTPLFSRTRAGMKSPFRTPEDPANAEIFRAWRDAIFMYPAAYLRHRWRVTEGLFGTRPRTWPHELVYVDDVPAVGGNPPVQKNEGSMHAASIRAIEALRDTPVFAAWPYLLVLVGSIAAAWRVRTRNRADANALLAVALSGLFYALPLVIVAPSAELRYLSWTCLSAVLCVGLLLRCFWQREKSERLTPQSAP